MNEVINAWMAGFIDGEGCLTIRRQKTAYTREPLCRPVITVTNTQKSALELFATRYGGHVVRKYRNPQEVKPHWRTTYHWYCPVTSIPTLLDDVEPYLQVKSNQAKALRKLIQNIEDRRGEKTPSVDLQYRNELLAQIHRLNHQ